jgi:hypothetical protein
MTLNKDESAGSLERFRQLVLADPELLARLRATADLESFSHLAVQLGRERRCEFTAADVGTAVRELRRAWRARDC